MKKSPKQRLCTKGHYENRKQTNSGLNSKTHLSAPSSHRIPIVSRPCIQPRELFSQPRTGTHSQKPAADQDSDQKVSIVVENPFDCLASFYFPEHADTNKSINGDIEGKTVESDKIAPEKSDTFPKIKNFEIHEAQE